MPHPHDGLPEAETHCNDWTIDVVAHHLRVFGAPASDYGEFCELGCASTVEDLAKKIESIERGAVYVALLPTQSFLDAIGASRPTKEQETCVLKYLLSHSHPVPVSRLRTLHPIQVFAHPDGEPLVVTDEGKAAWLKIPRGKGFILLIGTDLAGDLIRYRQGDPAQAENRPTGAVWGIAGERPNYLFDAQMFAGHEHDRPADLWAMALAQTVSDCLGEPLKPLLPNAAPGAIVITGDDDQAYLEKYQEQLSLLNGMPITYFLHPLTRHTSKTLATMARNHRVELGLHPDALEQPDRYAEIYREQAAWFHALTGQPAGLVRNHGFLNDGYWGHLPVWLEQGVKASSNLPGVNGKVLNGSLLPARMVWNGQLTSHWSILTAIGDGVRFALGLDGQQSAQCIRDMADRILDSKLPGVIVLNLHPQNVAETKEMHAVLHELVHEGFVPMTLGDCVDWFAARDRGETYVSKALGDDNPFARIASRIVRWGRQHLGRRIF